MYVHSLMLKLVITMSVPLSYIYITFMINNMLCLISTVLSISNLKVLVNLYMNIRFTSSVFWILISAVNMLTHTQTDIHTDVHTYRWTDIHTDIQANRRTDSHTDRQTDIQMDRHTDGQTYRRTDTRTQTDRHTDGQMDRHTHRRTYIQMDIIIIKPVVTYSYQARNCFAIYTRLKITNVSSFFTKRNILIVQ